MRTSNRQQHRTATTIIIAKKINHLFHVVYVGVDLIEADNLVKITYKTWAKNANDKYDDETKMDFAANRLSKWQSTFYMPIKNIL